MTTTEIATVPYLATTGISSSDANRATMLHETFKDLCKVDGFQSFHLGTPFESPESLQVLVDWDSRQDHEAFAASDAYKPWLERLDKAIDTSKAAFHHVDLQPPSVLSKAVNAPVTGISTFFCDDAPGGNWLSDAAKAAEIMGTEDQATSGFLGLAYGITHEELERDGVRGRAGVIVVGWESEEMRAAFRETQTFRECLGLLKGGAKAVEVVHVAFGQSAE